MCKAIILNDENISDVQLRNMNKAIGHMGSTSHLYYETATNKRMQSRFVSQQLGTILRNSRTQLETATSITNFAQITENEDEFREEEEDESENNDQEYEESSSASENNALTLKKFTVPLKFTNFTVPETKKAKERKTK